MNIIKMASDYLKEIKTYNIQSDWPRPSKTALLVIDMQEYFLPMASPILGNVISLIESCRSRGIKIIYTRHCHRESNKDGGMLLSWWGDVIVYGTQKWNLIKAINPIETEPIIDKNRYSAFWCTSLEEILKYRKIEDLIITGVMTNCCCETTAREAFMRDLRVFFVADATATVNEDLHMTSLKNLTFAFAYVVNTNSLCKHLENDGQPKP